MDTVSSDYAMKVQSGSIGNSKKWKITSIDKDYVTIQQKSSNRYLDAHTQSSNDHRIVTRTAQGDDTQKWKLTESGSYFEIQQKYNNRYLDAYGYSWWYWWYGKDYKGVTRGNQGDSTQKWSITPV